MTIDRSHGADEGYVIGREPIVVKLNPRVVVETLIGPAPIDRERLARAICGTRTPFVEEDDDLYVDDGCRAWAGRAIERYLENPE